MGHWQLASVLAFVLAAMGWESAMAAEAGPHHHVEVVLLAEKSAVEPGKTITVAVQEKMEPGWHTYWINPGDSGEPTSIEWSLPQGLSAGPILWPIPHVISVGPLAEYGYDDEVVLLTEIQVPERIEGDSVTLARESLLSRVQRDLHSGREACRVDAPRKKRRHRISIRFCRADRKSPFGSAHAVARYGIVLGKPAKELLRLTVSTGEKLLQGVKDARFFPLTWGSVSNPAPQPMKISGGQLTLDMKQGDTKETPEKLEGLLVLTKGSGEGERSGYTISALRGPDSATAGSLFDPVRRIWDNGRRRPVGGSGWRYLRRGPRRTLRVSWRRDAQFDALRVSGSRIEGACLCKEG